MSRSVEMVRVGVLAFALSASSVMAMEVETAKPVDSVEQSEAEEAPPLNLRACAALLTLTPGQWVIVDGRKLERVPGWAERVDQEDESFTSVRECARRIGLRADRAADLSSRLSGDVKAVLPEDPTPSRALPAPAPRRSDRAKRATEAPVHWLDENPEFVWQEWVRLPVPPPAAAPPIASPPVAEPAEPEPPSVMLHPRDMPEGWELFAGIDFSLGEDVRRSEPVSLVPVLALPEPIEIGLDEAKYQIGSIANILDAAFLIKPIPPIFVTSAVPPAAVPEEPASAPVLLTRSRSSDGAVAAAQPLPEASGLALVGLSLLAIAASRARR